jgi:hypothetical protein
VQTIKSTLTITIHDDGTYTLIDSDTGEITGDGVYGSNQATLSYSTGYYVLVTLHFNSNTSRGKGTLTSVALDNTGFFQEGKFSLKKQP